MTCSCIHCIKSFPNTKCFLKMIFCGPIGINLFISRDTCKDKAAYSWIFPNPAYAGLHWEFLLLLLL